MPLTEFQKGYLAGLLDGEGSIVVFKNTEKRKGRKRSKLGFTLGVTVKIFNKNIELLGKISEIYSGGKIYCSSKKNEVYCWQLNDKEKIVYLLEQLLPHLIVKKIRADKAIEFCKSRINRKSFKAGYSSTEVKIAEEWKNVYKGYTTTHAVK